ncbi:MAG: M20/M25/M40 family metallo-hydrolase [Desulfuromonadales bacterium]|nr:M20/M25/M40 family metallo-hydrolase [Desulfuromonadales bacterium]
MINQQRLSEEFVRLAAINSPPLKESVIARYLTERLQRFGAEVRFDNAAKSTGGEVGNLVATLPGTGKLTEPLLFSVHMDTVEPGGQVEPVLRDGVFYSAGDTVLGADDKAGIAELFEALDVVREQQIPHGPIEIVVTIAEEIGLVGAKHFDYSMVTAKRGYALDTEGVDLMVLQAPGANHLQIEIEGLASHAGMVPEQGVSAIQTAALAISQMRLGRIDHETTANIGQIEGGVARNIVPQHLSLVGEARSHDSQKLQEQTDHMLACFEEAAEQMSCTINGKRIRPEITANVSSDFPSMAVPEEAPVVTLAKTAAAAAGHDLKVRLGGGGSDANIFNANGIEMIILATGMTKVHTHDESVAVADMVHVSELLVEIIRQA